MHSQAVKVDEMHLELGVPTRHHFVVFGAEGLEVCLIIGGIGMILKVYHQPVNFAGDLILGEYSSVYGS